MAYRSDRSTPVFSCKSHPRKREISAYIVNGLTSKETAKGLSISHRTVDVHRFRLMKKLEAKNCAVLASKIVVLKWPSAGQSDI